MNPRDLQTTSSKLIPGGTGQATDPSRSSTVGMGGEQRGWPSLGSRKGPGNHHPATLPPPAPRQGPSASRPHSGPDLPQPGRNGPLSPPPKPDPHQLFHRHDTLSLLGAISTVTPANSPSPLLETHPAVPVTPLRAEAARTPRTRRRAAPFCACARRSRTPAHFPGPRARTHPCRGSQSPRRGFKCPCHAGGELGTRPLTGHWSAAGRWDVCVQRAFSGREPYARHRAGWTLREKGERDASPVLPGFFDLSRLGDKLCKQIMVVRIYCVAYRKSDPPLGAQ